MLTALRRRLALRHGVPPLVSILVFGAMLLGHGRSAFGQFLSTSSIGGVVTDETGSVLPGVSVTGTSTALQLPVHATTDSSGRFDFQGLPPGIYQMTFQLSGFQTLVRQGFQLTAGFTARVEPVLKLGAQSESVTVSGASPIVDVKTTGGGQLLSGELLNDVIPGLRLNSELGRITPGMIGTAPPNIGLLGATAGGGFNTYGESNFRMLVDGVNLLVGTFPDQVTAQEIDVRTYGSGPDISSSGAVISLVTKSGGNQFHGRFEEQYQNDAMQSNNLDAALKAQQLTTIDSTRYYNDFNGDLGGRIITDTLWFYGAYHDRRNQRTATGFVMNAGPKLTYDPTSPPFFPTFSAQQITGKLTYQANRNVQLSGFYERDISLSNGNLGSGTPRFTPYESSTNSETGPTTYRGDLRIAVGSRTFFNTQGGRVKLVGVYDDTPGNNTIVSRMNLATTQVSGGGISTGASAAETRKFDQRYMLQGNVTHLPAGRFAAHEFRTGYRLWWQSATPGDEPNHAAGNYQLVYNTVNGVPYTPVQINTYNFPVTQVNKENAYSGYVNDRWNVGARLTLNLGLRYDWNHAWVPTQTKIQGTFGGSGTFPEVDSNRWSNFAPRLGVAWDLSGSGKTLVKATYSRYNAEMSDTFAVPYNKNGVVTTVYRWSDPTHCDCYVPGTEGDFLSVSGSSNNIQNPSLKSPREHEISGSIEHEVAPNMSLRVLYVQKRLLQDLTTVNILRPYSVYTVGITAGVPQPNGTVPADAPTITVWDFPSAYKGSTFVGNQMVNRPDSGSDNYHTIEVTLNKRQSGKWAAITSFQATKNHRWLTTGSGASLALPQTPNDLYFPIDNTWSILYKVTASYQLPYDLQLAGLFDIQGGAPGQRTALFSTPNSGFVSIRLEPFGTQSGPVRSEANIRLSKPLKLQTGQLRLELDLLNAFNSNSIWTTTYATGSSFNAATLVQSPRVLRMGVVYGF